MSRRVCLHLRIEGRVQGVGYRDWLRATAEGVVDGWVRNRPDGSVEALVAGDAAAVEGVVAACRQGPPAARVTAVETAPAADPEIAGFSRR